MCNLTDNVPASHRAKRWRVPLHSVPHHHLVSALYAICQCVTQSVSPDRSEAGLSRCWNLVVIRYATFVLNVHQTNLEEEVKRRARLAIICRTLVPHRMKIQ